MTTEQQIRIGDTVEWWSQAGGFGKVKRGVVVAVVGPGQYPNTVLGRLGVAKRLRDYGMSRARTSYVVDVGGRLYWPRSVTAVTP